MTEITFEQLPQLVVELRKEVTFLKELLMNRTQGDGMRLNEELLTLKEAATFLNLSPPTIYSKVSKRELPALKQGKKLHFLKSELFEYLKRGRKKTNEEIAEEASDYLKKKGGRNG